MIDSLQSRRFSHPFAAVVCAALLFAVVPQAFGIDTSARSAKEIRARYEQLRPTYRGSPYLAAPNVAPPFAAGSLTNGLLQDGLNAINYARYLAGLPDDVALDPTYTESAQHGAVLLAAGEFAHSQPRPSSMDLEFYALANNATSSSNIGMGYSTLWEFNISCLGDEDTGNIERVGHRRWLLYPRLQKTGMGMASGRTATWVFDDSRMSEVVYDSVKWPSAGPFPIEMFGTETPWSITLNPALYQWTPGTAGHVVTLRRERDGKLWTFTSADTNKGGEYFNFETNGYGESNCFIFRPGPTSVGGYRAGDVFDVTLAGGITNRSDGRPATVSYRTEFISQGAAKPKAYVGTPKARSAMKHTKYYTVYGYLKPKHKAGSYPARIYKWRKTSSGTYKAYGYVKAKASTYRGYTKYSVKLKLKTKGKWRLRAYAPADSAHASAWSSGYDYVKVK